MLLQMEDIRVFHAPKIIIFGYCALYAFVVILHQKNDEDDFSPFVITCIDPNGGT